MIVWKLSVRLSFHSGLCRQSWGEKELCVLRAGCSAEALRWDEVGEAQRSQMDVFLMREDYLPFQTELQHSSKPVSSIRILIPPLVQLPCPLLCQQHVAPLGAGNVTRDFARGHCFPHLSGLSCFPTPAGSPLLVTPGHCSLCLWWLWTRLALC